MEINRRNLLAGSAATAAFPFLGGQLMAHDTAHSEFPKEAVILTAQLKSKPGEVDAVKEALACANAQPGDISALAYSSQVNSFVLLNADGACLTRLILWPDRRAASPENRAAGLWRREDFVAEFVFAD